MARKTVSLQPMPGTKQAPKSEYPKVVEVFGEPNSYVIGRIGRHEPSCFNGIVSLERYQIRIEKIDEPADVIEARLKKLWRESAPNHHHLHPMRAFAMKQFGWDHNRAIRELPSETQGVDHKEGS